MGIIVTNSYIGFLPARVYSKSIYTYICIYILIKVASAMVQAFSKKMQKGGNRENTYMERPGFKYQKVCIPLTIRNNLG